MLGKLRPRSVYDVLAVMGVFIALGGTTYAATGGNFVLGQGNTAGSTSSLTAPVAGKALQLTNPSTGSGASALGLTVDSSKPPFTTNSSTKVANLNADRLDGHDSSYFLPVFGKAADANTLDGTDSSGFVQGQGRIETIDTALPAGPNAQPLLNLPNFGTVEVICEGTGAPGAFIAAANGVKLDVIGEHAGSAFSDHLDGSNDTSVGANPGGDAVVLSLGSSGGKVATVSLFTYAFHNPVLNKDFCQYQGYAIVKGA